MYNDAFNLKVDLAFAFGGPVIDGSAGIFASAASVTAVTASIVGGVGIEGSMNSRQLSVLASWYYICGVRPVWRCVLL